MEKTEERLVHSPEQVAEIFGKSTETVRRWLRDGTIKGTKLARSWLIADREVRRILRTRKY